MEVGSRSPAPSKLLRFKSVANRLANTIENRRVRRRPGSESDRCLVRTGLRARDANLIRESPFCTLIELVRVDAGVRHCRNTVAVPVNVDARACSPAPLEIDQSSLFGRAGRDRQ